MRSIETTDIFVHCVNQNESEMWTLNNQKLSSVTFDKFLFQSRIRADDQASDEYKYSSKMTRSNVPSDIWSAVTFISQRRGAAQDTNYCNRRLHIRTPGFLLRVKLALLVVLRNILCMNDQKQWKTCVITFSLSIIFLCLGTREWLLLILIDEADSWRWGRVSGAMSRLTRDTLFWTDGVNNKQPTTDSSSQKIFLRLIAINELYKLHDRFKFAWYPFYETESVAKELYCADSEPQSQRASEVCTEWGKREGGEMGFRHPHPVIEAQGNPGIVELLHWLWREPSGYLNEQLIVVSSLCSFILSFLCRALDSQTHIILCRDNRSAKIQHNS